MAKKNEDVLPVAYMRDGQEQMLTTLQTDPKYSLEIDPTGELGMSVAEKKLLKTYMDCRSLPMACELCGISLEDGKKMFYDDNSCNERMRLNRAKNYRKFMNRLLSVDEIGGYLTSMLMDEDNVSEAPLSTKDKIAIVHEIVSLNKLKAEAYNNPRILENVEFTENDIQDLTPEDLKKLIDETKRGKADITARKHELINEFDKDRTLDSTDLDYLMSCSVQELERLVDEKRKQNKGETRNESEEAEADEAGEVVNDTLENLYLQEQEQ